jgi:hypothetical protein
LLSSLIVIAGSWKYALTIRFWALATKEELLAAVPSLQTAGTLVKWGLRSTIAAMFLNFGYALFRGRHDWVFPSISHPSLKRFKTNPEILNPFCLSL